MRDGVTFCTGLLVAFSSLKICLPVKATASLLLAESAVSAFVFCDSLPGGVTCSRGLYTLGPSFALCCLKASLYSLKWENIDRCFIADISRQKKKRQKNVPVSLNVIERPFLVSVHQRGSVRGGSLQRLHGLRVGRYRQRLIQMSGFEGTVKDAGIIADA